MNEENPNFAGENRDWEAPPPPDGAELKEVPEMSEVATLGNIFLEPGRTFEDLRKKPRFLLATLIIVILATAYGFVFQAKMGEERATRFLSEQMAKNPQADGMSPEMKQTQLNVAKTIMNVVRYVIPVIILIVFALGSLYYWVGIKAMGGAAKYLGAFSVWVYSALPPAIVGSIANFIVLSLKSADDIDYESGQQGVIHASSKLFLDDKSMPVLTTFLGSFDLIYIWGLILAVIGLQKVGKISKGSAIGLVFIPAVLYVIYKVVRSAMLGTPL